VNSEGLGFGLGWDFRLMSFLNTVQESAGEKKSLGETHGLKGGRRKVRGSNNDVILVFIDHDPTVKPWRTGGG